MPVLTLNETIKLLFLALDKPEDFTGKIILHFGQNCGLRNPQFTDPALRAELLPALKLIARRALSVPEQGGWLELNFHDGVLVNCYGQDRHKPKDGTRQWLPPSSVKQIFGGWPPGRVCELAEDRGR